jgi:hypothetical protein
MNDDFQNAISGSKSNGTTQRATRHDPRQAQFVLLCKTIGRFVFDQVTPLRKRIDALEEKLEHFEFCGTWRSGVTFRKSNFVVHDGSLFICKCDTVMKPGTDETWQLVAKRGRDGKDSRQ